MGVVWATERVIRRRLGWVLDGLLATILAVGFLTQPLVLAHFAALVLVMHAFRGTWRSSTPRLAVAVAVTALASVSNSVPLREVTLQLPFVYGVAGLVVVLADLLRRSRSASERAFKQVEHLALHDALTDLPNRALLHERVTQAIARARRDGGSLTLMLLDLDRFKEVNDTFGHRTGDALLRQIGPRLGRVLREIDSVARLGGDEFGLLLPTADATAATEVARRLLGVLEEPFLVDGQALAVGVSIGIATYPEHGQDCELLLQHADTAMYRAKRARGSFEVYEADGDERGSERLALMAELQRAIDKDELFLEYQPIIDARGGGVRSLEALVRWRHPRRGLIPPSEFIGPAERSGLIRHLSEWVLNAALAQARAWLDVGLNTPLSINLSMRDLLDSRLPETVARLLQRYGIRADLLTLEITEGALMADQERAAQTVEHLRALGIRLAVDDFGTGYSSIAYLNRLTVDEVKVDQSFVAQLLDDPSCGAIVRAIVDLGHALGFTVVAEGVEDRATLEKLAALGADRVQGYLVSRPIPAADVADWLHSATWAATRRAA